MQDYATRFLGQLVTVVVDRPLGSAHPKHGWFYPVNYGEVPGTLAPDGEPVDAYVLGVEAPVASFSGRCIAVIQRVNDDDDKLVVVPDDTVFADEEISAAIEFQERFFTSKIVR